MFGEYHFLQQGRFKVFFPFLKSLQVENYLLFSEFEQNLDEEMVAQKNRCRVRLREGKRNLWGSRASWQVALHNDH